MKKTTNKLQEEEMVTEMQPQAAPVAKPATPEEVATATAAATEPSSEIAAEAAPVESVDTLDSTADFAEPIEDMGTDEMMDDASMNSEVDDSEPTTFEAPAPGMVPSGWVDPSDLAEVVTQEIAAAQSTGDVEAAAAIEDEAVDEVATQPDESQPLVAEEAPVAPVTEPTESASMEEPAFTDLSDEEKDVILEYRKFKASRLTEDVEDELESEDDAAEESIEDSIVGIIDAEEASPEEATENFAEDLFDTEEAEEDTEEDMDDSVEIEDDDLRSVISDFLKDMDEEDLDASEVPSSLRAAADFFDGMFDTVSEEDVEPAEEDVEDEDDEEVEVLEDEELLEDEEMEDEEEELEESTNTIRESFEDLAELSADNLYEILRDSMSCEEILEAVRQYLDEDTLKAMFKSIAEDHDLDYMDESAHHDEKRITEDIIYPAGSSALMETSEIQAEQPVEMTESKISARRAAVLKYREALNKRTAERKHSSVESRAKFNEALTTGTKIQNSSSSTSNNAKSWSSNKFLDKFNESKELDFQKLLEEGVLG